MCTVHTCTYFLAFALFWHTQSHFVVGGATVTKVNKSSSHDTFKAIKMVSANTFQITTMKL